MRALILAQGDGRRWQRPDGMLPLGVPKHLIEVDGEALLRRTVRLLRDRGVTDVVVAGPDDDRYRVEGARLVTLSEPRPSGTSMDKLLGGEELWDVEGRTTILWGDCYYTNAAMDAIVKCDSAEPHWFRRPGPSKVTGHRWDESFALTFLPGHHERLLQLAREVARTVSERRIHMYTHYAAWLGMRMPPRVEDVATTPHQTLIDDWTDDIDSWAEWCAWMGRYMAGRVDVAVCVPWIDTTCSHRQAARDWTERWWQSIGVPVVHGSGPSRAAARNDAAARTDAQVLLFADADTVVPGDQLWAAAHLAQLSRRMVPAYVDHLRLGRSTTQQVLHRGPSKVPPSRGRPVTGSSSGCIAVTRGVNALVGGHDERFRAWGGEDRAYQYAVDTLTGGPGERIHGRSYHLWHPTAPDARKGHPGREASTQLALRYKAAAGWEPTAGILRRLPGVDPDPDAVRGILSEPGGPLHQ